jgi:carotenoid phi-ring synthase / carotenoid chi-ring synthase
VPHAGARVDTTTGPFRVAVVGGGLAGAAAATVLAERGAAVTLLEREQVLGGRLSGWPDRLATGEPFEMGRGFHAFFRQYHNVRNLLRRIDPDLRGLRAVPDYPLVGPNGARESFAGLPNRPPLNLIALIRRTPSLDWRALRAMDGPTAGEMLQFDPDETYRRLDAKSAAEYLDAVGFPPQARRMLFEVFARSFFNDERELSAAELIMMFHFYFLGSDEGLAFDVLDEPFSDSVWRPFARYLEALRVDIRAGAPVEAVERAGDGWRVNDVAVDAVVLALTVEGLQRVVSQSPEVGGGEWRADVAALTAAPPFAVWRLWLDRPTAPMREPFVGTAGLGIIDNVSCVHLCEGESRRWALRTGGSVVELHAYGLAPGHDEAKIKAELRAGLHHLWPETVDADVVDERFLLRADCPNFERGSHARRPGTATPDPTVVLAGDLVRLPFPTALMERAVASGFLAANRLLASRRVEPEPVWSIPPRGILAPLARLQRTAPVRKA